MLVKADQPVDRFLKDMPSRIYKKCYTVDLPYIYSMPYIYSIRMRIFLGQSPKPGCLSQIDPGFLHTSLQDTVSCMVTLCWGRIRSQ